MYAPNSILTSYRDGKGIDGYCIIIDVVPYMQDFQLFLHY